MRREQIDQLIGHVGAANVVEKLAPYLTPRRIERIASVADGRLFGIEVAVEEPYDPFNAAAVVRSAEAFGAGCVHVIGAPERILRSKKTTTGTFHWVSTRTHRDLGVFFAQVRQRGMTVAAACVDEGEDLESLPVMEPLCLLFGNESRGLSDAAKRGADLRYRIKTHGFAESLNVSVSAAVSLYSVTSRRRRELGRQGDLEPDQLLWERARMYVQSVDERLALGLLEEPDEPAGQE